MSIDLIGGYPLTIGEESALSGTFYRFGDNEYWTLGNAVWLDSVGLCHMVTRLTYPNLQPPIYAVTQLDGSTDVRSSKAAVSGQGVSGMNTTEYPQLAVDLSRPGTAAMLRVVERLDLPVLQYEYNIVELEPQTGNIRYSGGVPRKYNPTTIINVINGSQPADDLKLVAVLNDRYLFCGTTRYVTDIYAKETSLLSFPRNPLAPQVFTKESVLLGAEVYNAGTANEYASSVGIPKTVTASPSEVGGACWICSCAPDRDSYSGANVHARMTLYDYVNRKILVETHAPRYIYQREHMVRGVWWSTRFKVFIGIGDRTLNIYTPDIVPVYISRPVLISGIARVGRGATMQVRVTGDLDYWWVNKTREPCEGAYVNWTANGGTFSQPVSKTDANGYATSIYYPDAPTGRTITATVTLP